MNLLEIIKNLQEVITTSDLKVTDEVLFENAVKIFISDNINEQKKAQVSQTKTDSPASEKQIFYLKKLGYNGNMNITRQEAFKLIQEYKGAI